MLPRKAGAGIALLAPAGGMERPEYIQNMEIIIAWLTIASLIMIVVGLIDPAIALPWMREKSRKRAVMIYGYAFFALIALSVAFFPRTNLESKLYALFFLCVVALAAGLVNPRLVMPWTRDATKKGVLLFYIPPAALLIAVMVYANAAKQVDPRYYIPPDEIGGADQVSTVKYRAAAELRGQNNIGFDRVRTVDVKEAAGGGYDVFVEFNMDDVMLPSFFKIKAESDMTRVYKAVYTGGYDVKNVTVTAYFPVGYREKAGTTPPVAVFTTSLGSAEAAKVDWDANLYDLESDILPKVWKTEYKRPGFE